MFENLHKNKEFFLTKVFYNQIDKPPYIYVRYHPRQFRNFFFSLSSKTSAMWNMVNS